MERRAYATANSILAAARKCGLDDTTFRQLPGWRAAGLLDAVLDAFTAHGRRNRDRYWLWEDLREPHVSMKGSRELGWLFELGPGETPVWLIVEDFDGEKRGAPFWLFEATLAAAVATLENHHLLEFYIVSRSLEWLVGENHHDMVFAVGDHAIDVLRSSSQ